MTRQMRVKRHLQTESLESRQLLHGGAMAEAEPPTIEDRVAAVFQRHDANRDGELSREEVSRRVWQRVSSADGRDRNATVSRDELAAQFTAEAEERESEDDRQDRNREERNEQEERRQQGRREQDNEHGERERPSLQDRVDAFFQENDTNMDGVVNGSDAISEESLARIAAADLDDNGVASEELLAFREAQRQQRADARFDRYFARLDDDGDGSISEPEAGRRWQQISEADSDGNGSISADELRAHLDGRRDVDADPDTPADPQGPPRPDGQAGGDGNEPIDQGRPPQGGPAPGGPQPEQPQEDGPQPETPQVDAPQPGRPGGGRR